MRTVACLLVSALVFAACVDSDPPPARVVGQPDKAPPAIELTYNLELSTRHFTLPSASLGQERQVRVVLPPGYGGEPPLLTVSAKLEDDQSGVSSVVLSCINDDGDPRHHTEQTRTYPRGTAYDRYTLQIPVTDGHWKLVVTAVDLAGNRASTSAAFTLSLPRLEAWPTLYLNDGQDVAALQLEDTLGRLYLAGDIRPLVLVAIPSVNRRREYGASNGRVSLPCDFGDGRPGQGDRALEYERFVTGELVPHIRATFRVSRDPRDTGVLGESLGGLSAFSLAWNHSEVFGLAGALSGSFWWRETAGSLEDRQSSRIMHRLVREGGQPPLRAWFEAGTLDERSDRNGNGVIDAIEDTKDLLAELQKKGYALDRELAYVEVQGGSHDHRTWAASLPGFLRWAYPSR
jgi:enterochelin esterase family protein